MASLFQLNYSFQVLNELVKKKQAVLVLILGTLEDIQFSSNVLVLETVIPVYDI